MHKKDRSLNFLRKDEDSYHASEKTNESCRWQNKLQLSLLSTTVHHGPKCQSDSQASNQGCKFPRSNTNHPNSCERASYNSLSLQEAQDKGFA